MADEKLQVDIALTPDEGGIYDISFEGGDFKKSEAFDTAILMTIFDERRADESEVPDPSRRRGWWGNLLNAVKGFEQGSKIWLLEHRRLSQTVVNHAIDYARNGLQWLIDDGHFSKIDVSASANYAAGRLSLNVVLYRDDNVIETKLYELF